MVKIDAIYEMQGKGTYANPVCIFQLWKAQVRVGDSLRVFIAQVGRGWISGLLLCDLRVAIKENKLKILELTLAPLRRCAVAPHLERHSVPKGLFPSLFPVLVSSVLEALSNGSRKFTLTTTIVVQPVDF